MAVLALAGDTMLGRLLSERLVSEPFEAVFARQVRVGVFGVADHPADVTRPTSEVDVALVSPPWART